MPEASTPDRPAGDAAGGPPRRAVRPLLLLVGVVSFLAACEALMPQRTPGEKLYRRLCAECHGLDGRGNTPRFMGNPAADLTDGHWKHGGDPLSIEVVTREGIFGEMPAHPELTAEEMRELVRYVLSLRGETL